MRRSHRACERLFDQGVAKITAVVADDALSAEVAARHIQELARHHRVEEDSLEATLQEAWTKRVKQDLKTGGFSHVEELRLDALLQVLGLSNIKKTQGQIWKQVVRRRREVAGGNIETLVHEGMELAAALHVGAARPGRALVDVEADIRAASVAACVKPSELRALIVKGMEGKVEQMLEDGHLSHSEEHAVEALRGMFDIHGDDLDADSIWGKIARLAVLRDLADGTLPDRFAHVQVPFRLMKSETLIWVFDKADYGKVRTRREFQGGSSGFSLRVARGVYLRQSAFRGRPVEVEEAVHQDTGLLGITTKHIYFTGPVRSFRVRHNKLVSLVPFADGFGITRDTATAKPEIFRVDDGWFVYNLLQSISVE